jgi:iron(III) transport system substrate-binding protein
MKSTLRLFVVCACLAAIVLPALPVAQAADTELNLYSARHYQTDEALYADFTKQTGIKVNRIEAKEDELLERLKNEGAASPADVFITVDAARLAKADELGLFAPVKSKIIESRIPANLRTDNWLAFSTRARVFVVNPAMVNVADVQSYGDLVNTKLKGQVCTRSGSHPYNISLLASIIAHSDEARAEAWARGVVQNFARAPKGGDTDQIKGVAAGECGVAIANTYYIARILRSDKAEDRKIASAIKIVWPEQASGLGAHINVSGGGMLKTAPHKEAAKKFLEYLASDSAQRYFADGNNEWPAVANLTLQNPALDAMGKFKSDNLPIRALAKYAATAQRVFDRAGWK